MGEILKNEVLEPSGVLVINKHEGVTSFDIVNDIRHIYKTRRVGHTGTLDPMATGVLVVLVGRAAKASEYLATDKKTYRATIRLGLTTDTEDVTGKVLTTSEQIPSSETVLQTLEKFRGKIMQVPPMYSALKVNGQKLVDLARKGAVIEREAREIEIFALEATPTTNPKEYLLDVTCSGGTYIRTLCADMGDALGCGAVMATLDRVETGGFSLEQSHTVEEIRQMSEKERNDLLISIDSLFRGLPEIRLPAFFESLFRNGCEVYLKKIGKDYPCGTRIRIANEQGNFFALGEVREYGEGLAVKSLKLFVL